MDSRLETFVSNNPQKLLKLTKELFDQGFFNCYLSSQQFNLLNLILYNPVITDASQREKLWDEFMNGNINLNFYTDNEKVVKNGEDTPINDASSSQDNQKATNSTENGDSNKQEEDDDIDLNLKKGLSSSRSLLSKVRYLLWEQALDYYYASNGSAKDTQDEYEILDIEEHANSGLLETKNGDAKQSVSSATIKVRDEDDDYDDEEDDDDDEKPVEKKETEGHDSAEEATKRLIYNDNEEMVLEIPVSSITAPAAYPLVKDESLDKINIAPSLAGPSSVMESDFEKRNELKLIRNFNKVYHSFENDQKNLIKRRKLEESDKKLASINNEENGHDNTYADNDAADNVNKLISFGGAANLSLKNLLSKIDQSRDKLHLSDLELRNLILDVRKNRSKWASDDKIGQEELYEACERVVLELRGYTEHSTAFLNKVSKREAPNYYQVIKHPMDLNTVMKKLKSFQYKMKQQFVDDLMLIWKNCLTYNSDPSHFIRAHAIAMQKKTLSLAPLIPDITIRDRAEVEREEAELHKDDEKEVEEVPNSKATRGGVSSTQERSKAPKKGKKRARDEEEESAETPAENGANATLDGTPAPALVENSEDTALSATEGDAQIRERPTEQQDGVVEPAAETSVLEGTPALAPDENDEDDEDNDQQQLGDEGNEDEDEDLEFQTWSNLTSNARFKICSKRSELFKENKIQPDTEALLRSAGQMSNFSHYLGDEEGIVFSSNRLEYLDKHDHDEPYLIEYDVTGGISSLKFQGVSTEAEDKEEDRLVSEFLSSEPDVANLEPSKFVPNPNGLNKHFQENITLMQEVRKICFKISLIRQMQSQAFVHHTQMKPPEIEQIKEVDIDPISRLDNRDYFNRDVCYSALKRNVSKILMSNGFESADPFCIDVMTQIAEDYMGNLIKSVKLHTESQSINKISENQMTTSQILSLALVENGIQKPDTLHTYVGESIYKQTTKLKDIKAKLASLLKDLLRPGFAESINEKAFNEDSEQYLTGDFASEIGDDFFGFRELGLDKEFGLISQTIPLHLLHARLHNSHLADHQPANIVRYEDIVSLKYPVLTAKDVPKQIGLLQPFYESLIEKSKNFYFKQNKKEEEETNEKKQLPDEDNVTLVEDEELPNKQRNNRPRVPPTGKIPGIKKKLIDSSFFIEEEPEVIESHVTDPVDDSISRSGFESKDDFSNGLAFPLNGAQVV